MTFLVHFVIVTINTEKAEKAERVTNDGKSYVYDKQDNDTHNSGELADMDAIIATQAEQELAFAERTASSQPQYQEEIAEPTVTEAQPDSSYEYDSYPEVETPTDDYYESIADSTSDSSTYDDLDLGSLEDYSVDDILREYGFDDD
jgi:hypothetical protein